MSIEVEANLKIPRVKVPVLDKQGYPIDNGSVRFTRMIQVPAIPKPGAMIEFSTSAGHAFQGEVTRADWDERRSIFVVSCRYAQRSIPAEQCAALFNDADWKMKPLL